MLSESGSKPSKTGSGSHLTSRTDPTEITKLGSETPHCNKSAVFQDKKSTSLSWNLLRTLELILFYLQFYQETYNIYLKCSDFGSESNRVGRYSVRFDTVEWCICFESFTYTCLNFKQKINRNYGCRNCQ